MHKPQPRVTELNRPFWTGCNEGRMVIQQCLACSKYVFYPRACCPYCQHGELAWGEISGKGSVISNTTIWRTHHDGFNTEAPYVFAAIALAEGPCMYAQLREVPLVQSLVGRSVHATFVDHGPGLKLPAFELS